MCYLKFFGSTIEQQNWSITNDEAAVCHVHTHVEAYAIMTGDFHKRKVDDTHPIIFTHTLNIKHENATRNYDEITTIKSVSISHGKK